MGSTFIFQIAMLQRYYSYRSIRLLSTRYLVSRIIHIIIFDSFFIMYCRSWIVQSFTLGPTGNVLRNHHHHHHHHHLVPSLLYSILAQKEKPQHTQHRVVKNRGFSSSLSLSMYSSLPTNLHTRSILRSQDMMMLKNDVVINENNNIHYCHHEEETIFALATSSSGRTTTSVTAVAIIRLSGSHAGWILQQLLSHQQSLPSRRKAVVRTLYNPMKSLLPSSSSSSSSSLLLPILDQALVLYFPSPHSFTGEDVVELHCHGSRAVVNTILDCLGTIPIPFTIPTADTN
jgi:hypothetical protein